MSKKKEVVCADRQITIIKVMNEAGMSHGSAQAILTEGLQMKQVCAKLVLQLLSDNQRECRQ
jgi:hypothetical protein